MQLRFRAAAAVFALAIMVPVFASAQSDSNTFAVRTIEVDGSGETRTSPDTAELDLAIETRAKTAEEAAGSNASLAAKVIDALKSKLGDKGKITTGGYSLNPEYDQRATSETPKIVGYTAQNSVMVHTGAMDLAGALIDAAIAAGANRVNSLNFSRSARVGPRREARQGAEGDNNLGAAAGSDPDEPGDGDVGGSHAGRARRRDRAGDGFSHLRD
jgi:uncharacterized protein YggE